MEPMQKPEGGIARMCEKQPETIEVKGKEELRKLIKEIPEGTVYSLSMEVIMGGVDDDEQIK